MVDNSQRKTASGRDDLQNLPVQGLPGQGPGVVGSQNHDRVFDVRAFLIHYRHLKAGDRVGSQCPFCQSGPEALLLPAQKAPAVQEPAVPDGPPADQERDPPSPPGGGDSRPDRWFQ